MDVLVFGSLNVDLICYVNRLPKPGETLNGLKFSSGFGGKGGNQCVAAAKLGAKTAMIGKLGDDVWGKEYLSELIKQSVCVDFVDIINDETTGMAQITVAKSGENTIAIVMGANKKICGADVQRAKSLFENSKILLCQLENPPDAIIEALKSFKGISILNAAPALENTPTELLTLPSIFCVNETEAALTTGMTKVETFDEAKEALRRLISKGVNTVILTMGSLGVIYVKREEPNTFIHVSSPKVNAIDTTGAGDAFIGALAYYLSNYTQATFEKCVGAACYVAADSVTRCGTQKSYPTVKELNYEFDKSKLEWKQI